LKERYGDDPLTPLDFDPDLWMEVRSFGRLDKNRVYGFSNIMTKNLWMAYSVSTVGSSQLLLSIQSSEFTTLLQQGVQEHMTNLNEKYERLSTEYEELLWMVMDIDRIKILMSYPKYRSVEVINNPTRLGSYHKEVNYIKL
jgi:hypothetical protein